MTDNPDWKTSSEAWQREAQKMHRRAQKAEALAELLASALYDLRGCVVLAKGNFAVDDLKAQMALRKANTALSQGGKSE